MVFGELVGSESRSSTTHESGTTKTQPQCYKVNETYGKVSTDLQGAYAESKSECVCPTTIGAVEVLGCPDSYKEPNQHPSSRTTYEEQTTCESDGVCTTVYTKQEPESEGGTVTNFCAETITNEKPCTITTILDQDFDDCICSADSGGPVRDNHYPGNIDNHNKAAEWATIQHTNMTSQIDCGTCDG